VLFCTQQLVFRHAEDLKEINAQSFAKYGYGLSETELPEGADLLLMRILRESEPPADTPIENLPEEVDGTVYKLSFSYATPLKGVVTSPFGARTDPLNGEGAFHHGVDIGASKGTAIKAFAAGTVTDVGSNSVYGKYLRIDHGGGFTSFYGHCNKINVKKGQKIKLGQKIAEVGNTGRSTGPHLHFELRRSDLILNPSNYVKFS